MDPSILKKKHVRSPSDYFPPGEHHPLLIMPCPLSMEVYLGQTPYLRGLRIWRVTIASAGACGGRIQ